MTGAGAGAIATGSGAGGGGAGAMIGDGLGTSGCVAITDGGSTGLGGRFTTGFGLGGSGGASCFGADIQSTMIGATAPIAVRVGS